jgi:hypothetical protein
MKGAIIKSVIRYRGQPRIILRGNYKPSRVIRIRPAQRATLIVRPVRAGPRGSETQSRTMRNVAFLD